MICDYGEEYLPRRKTKGSAGYDFYFCNEMMRPVEHEYEAERHKIEGKVYTVFEKGVHYYVDTGVHLEDGDIKDETALWFLVPRSSLGVVYGMRFDNTASVIDMDYRDSIRLYFTVEKQLIMKDGDRIAQGILLDFGTFNDEIEPTDERKGGIGSTGA